MGTSLISAKYMFSLLVVLFNVSFGYCEINGYIFSSDGRYQVLNSTYQVLKEGNIYGEAAKQITEPQAINIIKSTSIYKIFHDSEANRLFFLIGVGQGNIFQGFLVFQLEPLKFIHFLQKEMTMEFDVDLLMHNKSKKFYVSYWADKAIGEYKPKTDVFNIDTFEIIKEFSNSLFGINERSCLIDDKLYNGRLFNMNTGEEIQKPGIALGIRILDCENGYVLGTSSKTVNEPITLVLANLTKDHITTKTFSTNEMIAGFSYRNDEWYLSKNARFIIRDEWKKDEKRTGRLVFFDVEKGTKKELKLSEKSSFGRGIIGFSMLGELLFYQSENKLYVINIQNQKIAKEIQLPFNPVDIVWP